MKPHQRIVSYDTRMRIHLLSHPTYHVSSSASCLISSHLISSASSSHVSSWQESAHSRSLGRRRPQRQQQRLPAPASAAQQRRCCFCGVHLDISCPELGCVTSTRMSKFSKLDKSPPSKVTWRFDAPTLTLLSKLSSLLALTTDIGCPELLALATQERASKLVARARGDDGGRYRRTNKKRSQQKGFLKIVYIRNEQNVADLHRLF